MQVARANNVRVIEDCAEAFGSYIGDTHVGNHGDIATFSFFGNKTITTGEGGMVTTNDAELHEKMKKLKGQGLAGTREYWHDVVGYNYRMTNICAAIGLGQLELADQFLKRKREITTRIKTALADLPVTILWEAPGTTSSFWMVTLATNNSNDRDPLRQHLGKLGVETRPAFHPAHTMPMYDQLGKDADFPVAMELASKGMNIPSSPALSDKDCEHIVKSIASYFSA
jgi:perosamine synthetase